MQTATCTRNCWIAAAVLGLVVWIFTAWIGPLRWFEGLFLGLVATGLFGVFLSWLLCSGVRAMDSAEWHPEPHRTTPEQDRELRPRGVASEAAQGFLGAAEGEGAHPVAPSGDAQSPSGNGQRAGSDRNDIYGSGQAKASGGGADGGQQRDKAAVARPDGKSDTGDDLKEIKGVGPKLEELLHENGITRFAQIAAWDEEEIDRHAELIGRMGGRIRSEDWVGQARVLADGGQTAFSRRVEEGNVY